MEARDIILPAAAVAVAATGAVAPHASAAGYDASLNDPAHWGSNCRKIDMPGNVMTYTPTGSNIQKVIVKGGTANAEYTKAPFVNLTAPINPKNGQPYAISHVIICEDGSTPASTTPATTTTTTTNSPKATTDTKQNAQGSGVVTAPENTKSGHKVSVPEKNGNKTTQTGKGSEAKTLASTAPTAENVKSAETVQNVATPEAAAVTEMPHTGLGSQLVKLGGVGAATYGIARALRKH